MYKAFSVCSLAIAAMCLTGCEVKKSSNPLSPSVAGPIPGVNITAPRLLEPAGGTYFDVGKQPITLSVENAKTNGARPLTYEFEVATDAGFSTKVFTRAGVASGEGKTSVTLPVLGSEKVYFWRAMAQDGANSGSYTAPLAFGILTPIVIEPPVPLAPADGDAVPTLTPSLTFANAKRSGPVGVIQYQLSMYVDSFSATGAMALWTVPEDPGGQTSFTVPAGALSPGHAYYWLVRAVDGTNIGDWMKPRTFRTPAAPTIPVPPTPGGGGGSSDFDGLGSVQIVGGSPDVRSWTVTSRITSLRFGGGNIHLEHTKTGQWPGVDIGGALQEMTLWVFFRINGQWYGTGGERWRPGQTDKALSAPSAIGPGWFYNSNWAPMTGYVPQPGELVGFMVVAGSTRADFNAPVHERSNILMIPFPADGVSASFP